MKKFKIFMGCNTNPADVKANKWLKKNTNIKIIETQYQETEHGNHSICILYKEK